MTQPRQRMVRGEDQTGDDSAVMLGLSRDRMIAVRTTNGRTVLLSPRAVSRLVDHLRQLQAKALEGVIWI